VAPTLSRWRFPFTGGKTLGSAFDWSKVFANEVYGKMATVELQSACSQQGPAYRRLNYYYPGTLNNAVFGLQLGNDQPVDLTVSGSYKDLMNSVKCSTPSGLCRSKTGWKPASTKTGSSSSPQEAGRHRSGYNLESPLAASNEEGAIHRLASGRRPDPETWFWSW